MQYADVFARIVAHSKEYGFICQRSGVAVFLAGSIRFVDIYALIGQAMQSIPHLSDPTLAERIATDRETRGLLQVGV